MFNFYEIKSLYEELECEQNKLVDNINEVIPFSISDNSTGSEERANKKKIKNKDDIKDIEFCESQKCIELNEEEERNNSENIKTLKCQNKKKKLENLYYLIISQKNILMID